MSDFHYVRTMGADGGVDVCSGQAIGEDLETVLADGLPPFNITLQLMAGLCEILDITDEDSAVHGNLELKHVFIDDTGAISIEAFGQRRTIAPEGKPKGHATDLYGLGSLAFRLFSGQTLPALPRDDADNHDDRVIDAILAIDFEGLNEDMVGDVQWYIAKLLSFDREDRPTAVETWRTFVAFADESPGPDFVYWCLEALEGRGERRNGEGSAAGLLDGPTVSKGPLNRGGLNFGGAAAEGTAFFTKADMKAALERSEVADQTFKPAVGGGSASSYWTKDQLRAMADGSGDAPRPKRAIGEGKKRRTLATTNTAVQAVREERAQQSQGRSTPSKAPALPEQSRPPSVPPHEPAPPPPKPPHATVTSGTEFFPLHPPPDAAELTVRMNANQVRTTRPTAPSPKIHRPPSSPGSIPKAPPPPGPGPAPPNEVKTTHLRSIQQPLRDEPTPIHSSKPAPRQLPVEPPVPAYQPVEPELEEEEGSSGVLILAGITLVVAISVVACFGVGGMGAVLAFFGASTDTIEVVQPIDPPDPEPALPLPVIGSNTEPRDPAEPTKPTPVPDRPTPVRPTPTRPTPTRPTPTRPTPTRPTPTRPTPTRPTPTRPTPTRPAPTPTPTPTPESTETPEVNPNVPVTLTLKSSGRGKLNCPSVGNKRFDGNTALNIEPYQLPATCVVEMDNKRAAFQVYATGMVTCNLVNSEVSCDKARVP